MTIEPIFSLVLAGGCLFALGVYLGSWARPGQQCKSELDLEFVDDNGLFCGWDGFTATEREQRLALYQRRIRARIAEQERAWLRAWLKESVAAGNGKNEVSSQGAGDQGGLGQYGYLFLSRQTWPGPVGSLHDNAIGSPLRPGRI